MPRSGKPASPFRFFNFSPEVIWRVPLLHARRVIQPQPITPLAKSGYERGYVEQSGKKTAKFVKHLAELIESLPLRQQPVPGRSYSSPIP